MYLLILILALTLATATTPPTHDQTTLWPSETYRYWVQTGQWKLDPEDDLLIVKNTNPADETTAIVTFNIPETAAGHKCTLLFDLGADDISTGSQQVDVFTATKPTGALAESDLRSVSRQVDGIVWSRDAHVGRISVAAPGSARWILASLGYPGFDCPAGRVVGFEFVGVNDQVAMQWDTEVSGPRVRVL
ncbi:hypothetical protein BDV28DRAFT_146149 [Aspergillus coremiiformis]|uniref:Uncharacterized protein n=1 Tax=Aspergillus coremiiformis TaxID=138285 RepID=A0A5N6ZCW3_9EURO|nr:hypothetical protein BDV28DRAFT_146149 [Aspergillus coremiiformis]